MKRVGMYYVGAQTEYAALVLSSYDVLLVTPGSTQAYKDWLDSIRAHNPAIKILCYHMMAEESNQTTIGPAVEHMKTIMSGTGAYNPFLLKADGSPITYNNGIGVVRLWDYTKPVFAHAWKTSIRKLFDYWPYDGILIDNCSCSLGAQQQGAFNKANASAALQQIISELRATWLSKLFVGNTSERYEGLDGVMLEGVNLTDAQIIQRLPQMVGGGYNILTVRGTDRAALYAPIINALDAGLCVI